MTYFVNALREHAELALFLTLAIGFFMAVSSSGHSPRDDCGHAARRVAIGQLAIRCRRWSNVFFDLFLFATGAGRASVFVD
jgi:hypothetical protein